MMDLSEKELLLLSNYLYIDECTGYGTIKDTLDHCRDNKGNIDTDKVAGLGIGGCMSSEECADILGEMDGCRDEFKDLNAVRSIDKGGIRAVCFEYPGEKNKAVVVFRGTGGAYDAWADNLRGEYKTDTDMQKLADDFVRYDCGVYDNIVVSGHSKGGNMAQYVTVTNRDRVQRCASFDGQGLSDSALKSYESQLKDASYRISSISGDKDYVNILLNPIALKRVYVKTGVKAAGLADIAVALHSSYVLYKSCEFDGEGNITNLSRQNPLLSGIRKKIAEFVKDIDRLPKEGNVKVSEMLAAIVASGLGNDVSDPVKKEKIKEAYSELCDYGASLIGINTDTEYETVVPVTDFVYADVTGLRKVVNMLEEMSKELKEITGRLQDIRTTINYKAASRLAVETIIRKQENKLSGFAETMTGFEEILGEISNLYADCENRICDNILCINFGG
ncbi:MAG: DUF2974 domain-containing protein [Lachnospiraceae bacterium]|nr:DUF2974 domain-containing protein [Lachnospiraceae bacterium]